MSEKQELRGNLSIDSGVILTYYLGEEPGEIAKLSFFSPQRLNSLYCSRQTVAELFYMLCRRKGREFARKSVEELLTARYLSVESSDEIDIIAGTYKCSRAISLVDCYVLAVAKTRNTPALFARHEDELDRELKRQPFDVKLLFLEDYVAVRGYSKRETKGRSGSGVGN